ncbi:GNAT family N-acetyltransferase [Arthrobacter antioxidans]|uniref:GNAT family N-acetyltransferase n=1 Tax=Arthrobacter antioxidans TaxID=2895818 RepID=UPI001FFE3D9D|nr:GNAT family N-acetyltransferase [Arthrobacter antioxidans]
MELDPGTVSIIQLAWSRLLGLDDDALASGSDRLYAVDDDASVLTFVTLFGREVLGGPGWAVEAGRTMSGMELRSHSTLLTLSRDHGGRGLGEAQLYFCDELPRFEGPPAVVSGEASLVRELERRCPPDDVAEAGLAAVEHPFVLLDGDSEAPPTPLAGAGYDIWQGILAHIAVITPPEDRRKGYAGRVAAVAVEDAMAAGLVPQWRARTDNTASQRTARRAGFAFAGTQTSVLLDA